MTVRYALTKAEIARSFLQSLGRSPRVLTMVLGLTVGLGIYSLAIRGAFSRSLKGDDVLVALAWMVGAFCFLVLWIFIRGKTGERTLTVSEEGISTEIGSMKGSVPWIKVKDVTETDHYVLIVGTTGNAFFIPSRAFGDPNQQTQFVRPIRGWRNAI